MREMKLKFSATTFVAGFEIKEGKFVMN